MSSGCAACPEPETMYLGLGCDDGSSEAVGMPIDEGGMADGMVL